MYLTMHAIFITPYNKLYCNLKFNLSSNKKVQQFYFLIIEIEAVEQKQYQIILNCHWHMMQQLVSKAKIIIISGFDCVIYFFVRYNKGIGVSGRQCLRQQITVKSRKLADPYRLISARTPGCATGRVDAANSSPYLQHRSPSTVINLGVICDIILKNYFLFPPLVKVLSCTIIIITGTPPPAYWKIKRDVLVFLSFSLIGFREGEGGQQKHVIQKYMIQLFFEIRRLRYWSKQV